MAILGVTFKADTDDLRESPAIRLARRLARRGAQLSLYDPTGEETAAAQMAAEGIESIACRSAVAATEDADGVVVATEWPEFRELDWHDVAASMRGTLVGTERCR